MYNNNEFQSTGTRSYMVCVNHNYDKPGFPKEKLKSQNQDSVLGNTNNFSGFANRNVAQTCQSRVSLVKRKKVLY